MIDERFSLAYREILYYYFYMAVSCHGQEITYLFLARKMKHEGHSEEGGHRTHVSGFQTTTYSSQV